VDVDDVNGVRGRYVVRRVFLPTRATESFAVIGPDLRPVELVDEYLAWLTNNERSPNCCASAVRLTALAERATFGGGRCPG
jgi:hypothetical protein